MDFELLITEIEQRPAIWDPRDPKHCNRDLIKKYWSEIAHVLQLEGMLVDFSENFHEKIYISKSGTHISKYSVVILYYRKIQKMRQQ